MLHWYMNKQGYRLALICFLLALALRLAILFGTGLNHKQDRFEMISVASTFARTGTIANAYMAMPTGPTAHVAPLYPILVGTVFRIFGDGDAGENVRQSLACAVSAARAGLLVLLALAFGLGEGAALSAGLLGVLYIGAFDTELKGDWEGPLAGDLLLILVLWGCRILRQRTPRPVEAVCYGLLWGAALLVAPALMPVGVALAALAFAGRYQKDAPGILRALACWAAGTVLVLSPWIVRNYYTLGGFVWGRDNFGLELSVSNGPGAHWSNPLNRPRIFSMHPSRYRPATERLATMGELAFNRERQEEALAWIRQNPGEFSRLTLQRAIHFWFPSGRNKAHQAALALFTLLAFAGFFLLIRYGGPGYWIVAAVWLSYPLTYYVIQWSSRYRLPIDWSLILCAALPLYDVWRRFRKGAEA
jgi:hypothetical protein